MNLETIRNNNEKFSLKNELFKEYPEIISVDQLQEMLNIGPVLSYTLVKKGIIPAMKIGREYKIPKAQVVQYILKGCGVKQ